MNKAIFLPGLLFFFIQFSAHQSLYSQKIFWSEEASLKKLEVSSGQISTIQPASSNSSDYFDAITIDGENENIYFFSYVEDGIQRSVKRTDFNGNDLQNILTGDDIEDMEIDISASRLILQTGSSRFPTGQIIWKSILNNSSGIILDSSSPDRRGITVDLINQKIYFSQGGIGIQRIDFDGSNLEPIISEPQLGSISKLAIDQFNGRIFWIQQEITDQILRANLDGSDIETVIESNFLEGIVDITDIAIDENASTLYWIGQETSTSRTEYFLKRSDFDGNSKISILKHEDFEKKPIALNVLPELQSNAQPFVIKHFSIFKDDYLSSFNSNDSPPLTAKVCADGSESSFFEIEPTNPSALNLENIQLRIMEDPENNEPDSYGTFSESIVAGNKKRFSFLHPLHIPGIENLFFTHTVQVFNEITNETLATFKMDVYRAPVLMVHGLWSDESAFYDMKKALEESVMYDKELLHIVDYKPTNAEHFHINDEKAIISEGIQKLIAQVYDGNISAGKVDIVAHSMGGILSRLYIQGEDYNNNVRKLITCNTPHFGSQFGNLLLDDGTCVNKLLCAGLKKIGMACDKGAVADLRVDNSDNSAITHLNSGNSEGVFIHSLTSTETLSASLEDVLELNIKEQIIKAAFNGVVALGDMFLNNLFNSPSHDIIVSINSQKGGLGVPLISSVSNQAHSGSVASTKVTNEVRFLLSYDPKGDRFTANGYNTLNDEPEYETVDLCNNVTTTSISININEPQQGEEVMVGEEVEFLINASDSVASIKIMIENDDYQRSFNTKEVNSSNLQFDYSVEPLPLGKRKFIVNAYNSDGWQIGSTDSYIMVNTDETPINVKVRDNRIPILLGKTRRISLIAEFEDYEAEISQLEDVEYNFVTEKANRTEGNTIIGNEIGEDFLTVKYKGVESLPAKIIVFDDLYEKISTSIKQNQQSVIMLSPIIKPAKSNI